jgi:hypothetical protein
MPPDFLSRMRRRACLPLAGKTSSSATALRREAKSRGVMRLSPSGEPDPSLTGKFLRISYHLGLFCNTKALGYVILKMSELYQKNVILSKQLHGEKSESLTV